MITSIGAVAGRTSEDRVHNAAAHLYDAECALHLADQSRVDAWISAANDKLHEAVVEYLATVETCPSQAVDRHPQRSLAEVDLGEPPDRDGPNQVVPAQAGRRCATR